MVPIIHQMVKIMTKTMYDECDCLIWWYYHIHTWEGKMLVMMTVMTMISWQWQISAAEDDAGLWQCMYNVRGRPCDAADSPMKREIWVVLLLLVICNCMRASFRFEVILLFLTLRAIIDGAFKCLFVITCIWHDFSEYIVYWLKGPVEPLSSSIDDFWSDEGHTYWLASPKLDLVRPTGRADIE